MTFSKEEGKIDFRVSVRFSLGWSKVLGLAMWETSDRQENVLMTIPTSIEESVLCVWVCERVCSHVKREGSGTENPSFHHCAEECQHDVWGHSSFKKLCSNRFYQACCSLNTQTRMHARTHIHTTSQTSLCVPERSLWGMLVHHFGYYPSLVVKYLCPADSVK